MDNCRSIALDGSNSSNEGLEATPQYRIIDCENGQHKFEITYDVSNFKPEDVRITLENEGSILVVCAKKEEKRGNSTVAREFKRQLEIPNSVDSKLFQCLWEQNGQLKVSAPLKFATDAFLVTQKSDKAIDEKRVQSSSEKSFKTITSSSNQNKEKSEKSTYLQAINVTSNAQNSTKAEYSQHSASSDTKINKITDKTTVSGKNTENVQIIQGPHGIFSQAIMSLSSQLLNSKEIKIKVSEMSKSITINFKIEEHCEGWSETRQISRVIKFIDSEQSSKLDMAETRAYLNKSRSIIIICVPLVDIDEDFTKELRVSLARS